MTRTRARKSRMFVEIPRLIPMHEVHLRRALGEWVPHYNRGRPHASLGPGIPQPVPDADQLTSTGHRLPNHTEVIATPILGGLHHEYRLARRAAPRRVTDSQALAGDFADHKCLRSTTGAATA